MMRESLIYIMICDANGGGALFGSLQDKGATPWND
jgi:hypothetical protein